MFIFRAFGLGNQFESVLIEFLLRQTKKQLVLSKKKKLTITKKKRRRRRKEVFYIFEEQSAGNRLARAWFSINARYLHATVGITLILTLKVPGKITFACLTFVKVY